MTPLSTIPFLFVIQVVFLMAAAWRAKSGNALAAAVILIASLGGWGVLSAALALDGVYDSEAFLRMMPGLWLPAVPFPLAAATLALPVVRHGLAQVADATPAHWFVAVQALRIAALGTLIKTAQGDFPLEVELAIGVTDLAFGLSALWLIGPARRGAATPDALVQWHVVGVLIIVLPGEVAMQSGLPGPFQAFDDHPTSEVMLDWPMVLAPSLVVPRFLLLNVLAAVAAHRSRASTAPRKEHRT